MLDQTSKDFIESAAEGAVKGVLAPIHDLIRELGGAPAVEMSEWFAMEIRFRKLARAVRLAERVREFLAPIGVERRAIPLRVLLPSIGQAVIEEDDALQDRYAALLANAATSAPESTPPAFVETLRQLSPRQAQFVDDLVDTGLEAFYKRHHGATGSEPIVLGGLERELWDRFPTILLAVGTEAEIRDIYRRRLSVQHRPEDVWDYRMTETAPEFVLALEVLERSRILVRADKVYYITRFGYAFVTACRPPGSSPPSSPVNLRAV